MRAITTIKLQKSTKSELNHLKLKSESYNAAIKRLISAYNFAIFDALNHLKKKKKIKEIPAVPNKRAEVLQKVMPAFKNDIKFYFLLKTIDKSEYSKKEEYRKNVALLSHIGHGEVLEVNTTVLKEYYERTVGFIETIETMINK